MHGSSGKAGGLVSVPTLLLGNCSDVLAGFDEESIDACVTDPPYHLTSVSRNGSARSNPGTGPASRYRVGERGFMGSTWDGGGVAFDPATWAAVYRVLKPGARLLAFGGSRTHHRIWCAIEDAGFTIEDTIMWLYGSGFPKHRSKLKPAFEPICVARKGPVSELNIDACRIATEDALSGGGYVSHMHGGNYGNGRSAEPSAERRYTDRGASDLSATPGPRGGDVRGRWPANVVLDEDAAAELDKQSGERRTGFPTPGHTLTTGVVYGRGYQRSLVGYDDAGGASRFYFCSKTSRSERDAGLEGLPLRNGGSNAKGFTDDVANGQDRNRPVANHHPTVKPIDLMRWLVRLITQPGDLVLDPFMGSGTTGVACVMEGRRFIGIDQNADYLEIARHRIAAAQPTLFDHAATRAANP